MKKEKTFTETYLFCDYCGEDLGPFGYSDAPTCPLCGKDICDKHKIFISRRGRRGIAVCMGHLDAKLPEGFMDS